MEMEYVNTPVSYAEEQEQQLQQALFALHQVYYFFKLYFCIIISR